jgi:hypothetical protein
MADQTKSLTLRIKGDTENARREFSALLKDLKGVDSGVLGVGKNFKAFGAILGGLGVGVVLGTLAAGLRAVFREATEAERIEGKLNAVLKATDGAAGLSAVKLNDMADALARTTQFDDEALKEAMTVLLAFPAVGSQVFGEAIQLATDLSVVMGGDLNGAARAVGRALQDPVGGLRLLKTELGINTEVLGENNEALLKSGDLLGAQKNVIAELQSRLGGAAAGANTGLFGATQDVGKAWNDLLETIGRTPEIAAGAQASLTSLTGILRLLNDEMKQRNENVLRGLGALPPRRLGGPKEITRENLAGDFSGGPKVKTDVQLEAEKKASEEFRKALLDLEKRTELLGEQKAAEQILFEVQKGRYKDLQQFEKDALVAAAQRLDTTKVLADFEQETFDDLQQQIAAENDYNAALKKSADAVRDVIDPTRALFLEMEKLNELFARGFLSPDEFIDATLEVQGRLEKTGEKITSEMTEFAKEAARGMQSAFADEFFDIFEGKVDNLGESFVRLLHRLAAELAASEVMKFLTGDFGKTGQVGGVLGTFFASLAHTGGIVGSGLPGRQVPALAFAGAPRMHAGGVAGLAPDEVPTILKRGEVVMTPEQLRGGPGNVRVQIENKGTPQQVTEGQATFDPEGAVIRIVTEDARRGGPISTMMARTFNLRRQGG